MSAASNLGLECEATREAVEQLIADSGGFFEVCVICGKTADEHPVKPGDGQQ